MSNTGAKIKSYVERVERLEDERKGIGSDIRDIYTEAKGNGFNAKALRKLVAERRRKTDAELEADLEMYRAALAEPGATYRSVAAKTGASKSKLQRLVPQDDRGTDRQTEVETPPGAASGTAEVTTAQPAAVANPHRKEEEASSGGDAGHRSEPSRPAEQSVRPAPPPERVSLGIDRGKGSNPALTPPEESWADINADWPANMRRVSA